MNKANKIYIDNSKARINVLNRKDLNKLYRQLLKRKEIRLNYMQGLDELIKRLDS